MNPLHLRAGRCEIEVLGVIKGLVSEGARVQQAFDGFRPDKVVVSISREELEGLRNIPEDFAPELTRYEEIYAAALSRFGEVAIPPPCYVAVLELSAHAGVSLEGVDLDEESFSELYCSAVPAFTLFRHSIRTWLLRRRRFGAETAEEFVLAWDRAVNSLAGFATLERKRAESMAEGILRACDGSARLLAVIELERAEEVGRLISERLRAKRGKGEEGEPGKGMAHP